jgi:hypothetical protein
MNDSNIYLQSDYIEPLITNVNGADASVIFLPHDYDWSNFTVNFHYKQSNKKESIYQIRGIQVASSVLPDNIYDLTENTFVLNKEENEISIKDPNVIVNALDNLRKQGAIRFSFFVDLLLDKGSIYYQPHVIDVFLTQFAINGTVSTSTSLTSNKLDLTQTSLKFSSVTNSDLVFEVIVDSTGKFKTKWLPIGTYFFEATLFAQEQLK